MKTLKIGELKLKNPLLLAPMVDVTDLPYRLICKKAGAGLTFTEMLNIGSILHENKKTLDLMKTSKEDKPIGIQITAPKVSDFKKVIPYLKNYNLVDINCGCPSVRIIDNASGSYLLKNPAKIASYVKVLKNAGYIVTTKIRLGFKNNNVLAIAKTIEKAGADAITVHARLSHHSNKIPADWSWIAKVKKQSGIPIIGNGDVSTPKHAEDMLDIADGVMIARSAIGDPLIFSRTLKYLKNKKEEEFDFKKNIQMFKLYIKLAEKHNLIDLHRIRYLAPSFLKNQPGVAKLRGELMQKKTFEEIKEFVNNI